MEQMASRHAALADSIVSEISLEKNILINFLC